jgi:hypothetical protein
MGKENNQTYDFICFSDLVYESDLSDKKEIEKKIKRRLKYHKLGDYQQERVDYIRNLKNDLHKEIASREQSGYFKKIPSEFAELADFNIAQMKSDYLGKYNTIKGEEMLAMLNFAIYSYHLR